MFMRINEVLMPGRVTPSMTIPPHTAAISGVTALLMTAPSPVCIERRSRARATANPPTANSQLRFLKGFSSPLASLRKLETLPMTRPTNRQIISVS